MPDNSEFISIERSVWGHNMFPDEKMSHIEAWLWIAGNTTNFEITVSFRFLAKKFKWSIGRVVRFLKKLEDELFIEVVVRSGQNHSTILVNQEKSGVLIVETDN